MKNLGYYNGKYDELEKMSVPMLDRVCYFGDGIYDATYSRNHIVYTLDEHIDRFYNSAKLLEINLGHTKDEMKEIVCEMVKKVDDGEQFVYLQATRGTGIRNHAYKEDDKANIWMMIRPVKIKDTYQKIKTITLEDKRFLYCNIKTLNLIPSVIYSKEAERAGCDETILHRGGRVTECAHSNVSIIKDGVFRTAPTDCYILPGIARMNLIKFSRKLGIPVDETAFTLDELMDADEVIVSSAGSFCLAVETIDGKPVGGKAPEILRKLQDALMDDFIKCTDTK